MSAECGTPFAGVAGVCVGCGKPLAGRQTRWCASKGECENEYWARHSWGVARVRALKTTGGRCSRSDCDKPADEVNHIEPRVGRGYNADCAHHPENLEPLCHAHHVAVTNAQRLARVTRPPVNHP